MDKKSKEFLFKYLNNASPTGFEASGQQIWLEYIKPYVQDYTVDVYGSVVGVINPKATYKVVIEAHADEISWFVNYITEDGYIYVRRNGGSDHQMSAPVNSGEARRRRTRLLRAARSDLRRVDDGGAALAGCAAEREPITPSAEPAAGGRDDRVLRARRCPVCERCVDRARPHIVAADLHHVVVSLDLPGADPGQGTPTGAGAGGHPSNPVPGCVADQR